MISIGSKTMSLSLIGSSLNITHFHLRFFESDDYYKCKTDDVLQSICDNLTHLKSLSITNTNFSSILCINKFKNLENLEIKDSNGQELYHIDFKYLRSLKLYSGVFYAKHFAIFVENFQN